MILTSILIRYEFNGPTLMRATRRLLCLTALLGLAPAAWSAEPELKIVIRNHQFTPSELTAPAGQKIKLVIENQDPTPEEFESYSLNREKIVPGGGRIVVYVGPLKPGRYEFFGEFNAATARGWLVVEP
jgi:hypothetical protein